MRNKMCGFNVAMLKTVLISTHPKHGQNTLKSVFGSLIIECSERNNNKAKLLALIV